MTSQLISFWWVKYQKVLNRNRIVNVISIPVRVLARTESFSGGWWRNVLMKALFIGMQPDLKEVGGWGTLGLITKGSCYFCKPSSGGINNNSWAQLSIGIMKAELLNQNCRVSNQARSQQRQDRSERATCFRLSPPVFWPPVTTLTGQAQPEARGQGRARDGFCRGQPPRAQSRAEMDREWIPGR